MKFTEFVRKNQNVITGTRSTRISESIPISADREKFYSDEQFTKYDVVESEGKKLRILEKCSNYYACVDESGNVVRKFANALTLTEDTTPMWTDSPNQFSFHGYAPTSAFQENKELRQEWFSKMTKLDENTDDIALLKELKEADKKVPMETDYKLRDKLTIAKLIADAVGIPHDPLSTPENLVNAAIRKARKDPALMRNKAVLANMLEIAKSVGIKFSDSTFEVKEEVDEATQNSYFKTRKNHEDRINGVLKTKPRMPKQNSYFKDRKDKEDKIEGKKVHEEVLNEDPLNAWKNRMKAAGAVHYISGKHQSGTTASKLHAYKIVDGKKVKVGAFDQVGRRGIKEDTLEENKTASYSHHHAMYLKYLKSGNGAMAKHHADIRDSLREDTLEEMGPRPIPTGDGHGGRSDFSYLSRQQNTGDTPSKKEQIDFHKAKIAELGPNAYKSHIAYHEKHIRKLMKEDTLDELNIDTVKRYSEKVKTAPVKSIHQAFKHFQGKERAVDRIHTDELKKMTDRLKESEELVEKFGVFRKGGSIGDNKQATPVKVHDTAEDAKAHAKRLNKLLSPGEKNYYGMKYHTKQVSEELDEAKVKPTHKVSLEFGIQEGDYKDYHVAAASRKEATEKAIKLHRKSYPHHTADMLRGNSRVTKLHEEVEPLTLKSLRKKMEMDVPIPDENDYAAKNKEMMGGEPTEVTPEMTDDNTGMTPDAISFRDIVKKLNATMVPKSDVATATDKLPHGNAMNPTSDTHRKQLIRKLQGN